MTPTPTEAALRALEPCPFCGGEARILKGNASAQVWDYGEFHRVFCTACQLRQLFYRTEAEAIAAWNRRTPEVEAASRDVVQGARHVWTQTELPRDCLICGFIEYECGIASTPPASSREEGLRAALKMARATLLKLGTYGPLMTMIEAALSQTPPAIAADGEELDWLRQFHTDWCKGVPDSVLRQRTDDRDDAGLMVTPLKHPTPAADLEARARVLPIMRTAFRTTTSCGGEKPSYEMTFRFRTMEEMHRADDEWIGFSMGTSV